MPYASATSILEYRVSNVEYQIAEVRMLDQLSEIEKSALDALAAVDSESALEAWRACLANMRRRGS
jgi:hypothetical protein